MQRAGQHADTGSPADQARSVRGAVALRVIKLVAASVWAGVLITIGGLLWPIHPAPALCAIAAGECVVMWLIADDLWPDALPGITTFFKLTGALVFFGELIVAVWLLWPW